MATKAAMTATGAWALQRAAQVEAFVREVVAPYENNARIGRHGPDESLVFELRDKARSAGILTPHIPPRRGASHPTRNRPHS